MTLLTMQEHAEIRSMLHAARTAARDYWWAAFDANATKEDRERLLAIKQGAELAAEEWLAAHADWTECQELAPPGGRAL